MKLFSFQKTYSGRAGTGGGFSSLIWRKRDTEGSVMRESFSIIYTILIQLTVEVVWTLPEVE